MEIIKNNQRINWIDFLKGIGIVLVVFGHFIEPFIEGYQILKIVFILIYTFHMPLFCILSGLVSHFNVKKIRKYINIYFFSEVLYLIFRIIFLKYPLNLKSIILAMVYPYWHLWYLEAFIIWNITLVLENKFLCYKNTIFITTIIISLLSGYMEIPFSLQRVLTFYPFFIFGYLYKNRIFNKTNQIQNKNLTINIFLVILLFSTIALFNNQLNLNVLFEGKSYIMGDYNILNRLIFTVVGICLSYNIIILLSNYRVQRIENRGGYTLPIFILHASIFWILNSFGIHNYIKSTNNLIITSLYITICSIFCIWFFSIKMWIKLFKKIGDISLIKRS